MSRQKRKDIHTFFYVQYIKFKKEKTFEREFKGLSIMYKREVLLWNFYTIFGMMLF